MVILLMIISDYYVGGYRCLLLVIILVVVCGYFVSGYWDIDGY